MKDIYSKLEYELVGIYADDGISGTNTKKCDEFNRMIEQCILYIISIPNFT